MQSLARHHRGKCLSTEYIGQHSPLKWMCAKGHTWESTYVIVTQGGWCRQCEKQNYLEEFKAIAKENGGKCLSDKHVNFTTRLKFQCKRGHIWMALPNTIRESWCRKCMLIEKIEKNFEKLKLKVAAKGGIYISGKFVNKSSRIKWQCENGHQFFQTPNSIRVGKWCAACNKAGRQQKSLDLVQEIARNKGGKCLSDKFIRKDVHLKFQCKQGHIWMDEPGKVKLGKWCPHCSREVFRETIRKYSIPILQKIAKERSGKLLSKKYINSLLPLTWECSEGHTWIATVNSIVGNGSWCVKCFRQQRKTSMKELERMAKKNGGKLLSTKYENARILLQWQCKKGHKFSLNKASVRNGVWCPTCMEEQIKNRLYQKYVRLASQHGGRLISKKYIDNQTKLEWECANGHRLVLKPSTVRGGWWCIKCNPQLRLIKN